MLVNRLPHLVAFIIGFRLFKNCQCINPFADLMLARSEVLASMEEKEDKDWKEAGEIDAQEENPEQDVNMEVVQTRKMEFTVPYKQISSLFNQNSSLVRDANAVDAHANFVHQNHSNSTYEETTFEFAIVNSTSPGPTQNTVIVTIKDVTSRPPQGFLHDTSRPPTVSATVTFSSAGQSQRPRTTSAFDVNADTEESKLESPTLVKIQSSTQTMPHFQHISTQIRPSEVNVSPFKLTTSTTDSSIRSPIDANASEIDIDVSTRAFTFDRPQTTTTELLTTTASSSTASRRYLLEIQTETLDVKTTVTTLTTMHTTSIFPPSSSSSSFDDSEELNLKNDTAGEAVTQVESSSLEETTEDGQDQSTSADAWMESSSMKQTSKTSSHEQTTEDAVEQTSELIVTTSRTLSQEVTSSENAFSKSSSSEDLTSNEVSSQEQADEEAQEQKEEHDVTSESSSSESSFWDDGWDDQTVEEETTTMSTVTKSSSPEVTLQEPKADEEENADEGHPDEQTSTGISQDGDSDDDQDESRKSSDETFYDSLLKLLEEDAAYAVQKDEPGFDNSTDEANNIGKDMDIVTSVSDVVNESIHESDIARITFDGTEFPSVSVEHADRTESPAVQEDVTTQDTTIKRPVLEDNSEDIVPSTLKKPANNQFHIFESELIPPPSSTQGNLKARRGHKRWVLEANIKSKSEDTSEPPQNNGKDSVGKKQRVIDAGHSVQSKEEDTTKAMNSQMTEDEAANAKSSDEDDAQRVDVEDAQSTLSQNVTSNSSAKEDEWKNNTEVSSDIAGNTDTSTTSTTESSTNDKEHGVESFEESIIERLPTAKELEDTKNATTIGDGEDEQTEAEEEGKNGVTSTNAGKSTISSVRTTNHVVSTSVIKFNFIKHQETPRNVSPNVGVTDSQWNDVTTERRPQSPHESGESSNASATVRGLSNHSVEVSVNASKSRKDFPEKAKKSSSKGGEDQTKQISGEDTAVLRDEPAVDVEQGTPEAEMNPPKNGGPSGSHRLFTPEAMRRKITTDSTSQVSGPGETKIDYSTTSRSSPLKPTTPCNPCGKAKMFDRSDFDYSVNLNENLNVGVLYEYSDQYNLNITGSKGQRIVGGRAVKEDMVRAWQTHIIVDDSGRYCGGALINHLYVLTAAHCICPGGSLGCKRTSDGDIELKYNISTIPGVFLGATHLSTIEAGVKKQYRVKRAIVHKKFNIKTSRGAYDIALLELDTYVQFVMGNEYSWIMPICMPTNSWHTISRGSVHGFGELRNAKRSLTNGFGPEKYRPCTTPCRSSVTPAVHSGACSSFNKQHQDVWTQNDEKNSKRRIEVVLQLPDNNVEICYSTRAKHGWCSTNNIAPTPTSDWGFCTDGNEPRTESLYETKLHVFDGEECKMRTKEAGIDDYNPKVEFCAGYKFNTIHTLIYSGNKTKDRKDRWEFSFAGNESKVLTGLMGGRDSCKGDSGNPLFIFDDEFYRDEYGKATIHGLVSRGSTDCGQFATPGIYTNVSHFLNWITDNVSNGFCSGDDLSKETTTTSPYFYQYDE